MYACNGLFSASCRGWLRQGEKKNTSRRIKCKSACRSVGEGVCVCVCVGGGGGG